MRAASSGASPFSSRGVIPCGSVLPLMTPYSRSLRASVGRENAEDARGGAAVPVRDLKRRQHRLALHHRERFPLRRDHDLVVRRSPRASRASTCAAGSSCARRRSTVPRTGSPRARSRSSARGCCRATCGRAARPRRRAPAFRLEVLLARDLRQEVLREQLDVARRACAAAAARSGRRSAGSRDPRGTRAAPPRRAATVGRRDDPAADLDLLQAAQAAHDARSSSTRSSLGCSAAAARRSRPGTACRRPPSSSRPALLRARAGERAALVAEQLALEQRLGDRGAVHRDERLAARRAFVVDAAREQLLAGARLAHDQHRRQAARRHLARAIQRVPDRVALTDDTLETELQRSPGS